MIIQTFVINLKACIHHICKPFIRVNGLINEECLLVDKISCSRWNARLGCTFGTKLVSALFGQNK